MRLFIKLPRFTFILGLKIFSGTIISIFSLVGQAEAIVKGTENSVLTKYSVMVLDDHGHVCSAAVLNKKVILTAAHCVADATDWRIHWRSDDGTPILIKPNKVLVHPGYEPNAISKRKRSVDLALISLSNPLPDQFLAIPLSPVSELSTGEIVTVAGFGFSEEKNIKTTGKLRSVDLAVVAPFGISRSILWLADAASKGAGGCQGDSGGPILYQDKLFAIVSWSTGEGKSDCGTLTQGIILAPEMNWINHFIEGLHD